MGVVPYGSSTCVVLSLRVDVTIPVELPNTIIPALSTYGSINVDDKRKQPIEVDSDDDEGKEDDAKDEFPDGMRCYRIIVGARQQKPRKWCKPYNSESHDTLRTPLPCAKKEQVNHFVISRLFEM